MMEDNEYLKWLYGFIGEQSEDYSKLLYTLYCITYEYTLPKDKNRYLDGVELRKICREEGNDFFIPSDEFPCSVLEMLIAFARRIEIEIMQDPLNECNIGKWFWQFIDNLYLMSEDDECIDYSRVDGVIKRFMNHEYDNFGNGNIFYFKDKRPELKNTELWYQMNWWIMEKETNKNEAN